MKWRDLTPEQLRGIVTELLNDTRRMSADRVTLARKHGFDVVASTVAMAHRLLRVAAWNEHDTCVVRHGFDIGGVLSKYPDIMRPTVLALLAAPGIEVHVLSDMHPHSKCVDWIHRNGFPVPAERIHSCDYDQFGEECKAVKARELDLHVLWDDFVGYVATVNAPPVRLLVMPDPTRDYYHESWLTDGSEGNFGRRIARKEAKR